MFIVNKDQDQIINMDNVTNIFIKNDRRGFQASFTNGQGSMIGQYGTQDEARAAMEVFRFRLEHHPIAVMPSDQEVKAWISSRKQDKTGVHHYHDGSKSKGHGGS